jgi:hypothetical protein
MLVDKATNGAPERRYTLVGTGITRKDWIRLKRPSKDKQARFLESLVNYGRKKFDDNGPRTVSQKKKSG